MSRHKLHYLVCLTKSDPTRKRQNQCAVRNRFLALRLGSTRFSGAPRLRPIRRKPWLLQGPTPMLRLSRVSPGSQMKYSYSSPLQWDSSARGAVIVQGPHMRKVIEPGRSCRYWETRRIGSASESVRHTSPRSCDRTHKRRPVPVTSFVEKNGSKILVRLFSGIPGPLSATVTHTLIPDCEQTRILSLPPIGSTSTAFNTRLRKTWRKSPGRAIIVPGSRYRVSR